MSFQQQPAAVTVAEPEQRRRTEDRGPRRNAVAQPRREHPRDRLDPRLLLPAEADPDQIAERRIAQRPPALELPGQEGGRVVTGGGGDARCRRGQRLHDHRAAGLAAPAAPGQLRDHREGPLLGAEVREAQRGVGVENDAERHLGGGTEEAMAVNHVLVALPQLHGNDVPGHLGGERDFPGILPGAVLRHEDAAAPDDALEDAEQSAAPAHLRMSGHLDGLGHPGELATLREDAIVGVELHFEQQQAAPAKK